MANLRSDLGYALRALLRSPGFVATTTLTLSIGMALTGMVFSIVNGTVLNALPWSQPDELVHVADVAPETGELQGTAPGRFLDLVRDAKSFAGVAAVAPWRANLASEGEALLADGARVSDRAFEVAGVRPLLGRGLGPADYAADAAPVVVLSEGLWKRAFGASPDIIGREIEVNQTRVTVAGVLAESRWFPYPWVEIVAPLTLDAQAASRSNRALSVFARLGPDVHMRAAQADLDVVADRLGRAFPDTDGGWGLRVRPLRDRVTAGAARAAAWIMLAAGLVVLLMACANVASLQLARALGRQKEVAVRAAIGGSRGAVLAPMLVETLMIAVLALPVGVLLTHLMVAFILQSGTGPFWLREFLRIDQTVIVFSSAALLGAVLLSSLSPAWAASRADLSQLLRQAERGSTSGRGTRLRACLVTAQISLAVLLLVCASLLAQRFLGLQSADPRFQTRDLKLSSVELPRERYPTTEQSREFQLRLQARLDSVPALQGAALASWMPFGDPSQRRRVQLQLGSAARAGSEVSPSAWLLAVSPKYFSALGVPLVEGRSIDPDDREQSPPVAVVNQAFGRRYFPDGNALGQEVSLPEGSAVRIVGIAQDMVQFNLAEPPDPQIFVPLSQLPATSLHIAVRSRDEGPQLSALLRAEIQSLDPALPILRVDRMEQRIRSWLWPQQLSATTLALLAAIALALELIGLYGLVSYSTARRTGEFGIRLALGADRNRIGRLVVREAVVLCTVGVAIGSVLAFLAARAMVVVMPGTGGVNVPLFVAVSLVLLLVGMLASAVPALRAARLDPMILLRTE